MILSDINFEKIKISVMNFYFQIKKNLLKNACDLIRILKYFHNLPQIYSNLLIIEANLIKIASDSSKNNLKKAILKKFRIKLTTF
jgi:hypothetical protein